MTKKTIKIIALIVMAIVTVAVLSQGVFATTSISDVDVDNMFSNAQDTSGAAKAVGNIIGSIITVVQVVGTGVAIIMLIVLAIKYIAAAPGDKADIKKHAVVYIVGAVVLFAATGILGIVKGFAGNVKIG